jgi:hypothetical protein
MKRIEALASILEESARRDEDLEAARMLRSLGKVFEVASEVVYAKTHTESMTAYGKLIDVIKEEE